MTQQSIIADERAADGGQVTIETSAAVLKPALPLITALDYECKLDIDEGGLSTVLVDPPNISLLSLAIPAEAFDSFDCDDEMLVGLRVDQLKKRLHNSRSRGDADDLTLTLDSQHARLDIEREYETADATWTHQFRTIDPDSVRQQPELPPDELIEASVDLDLAALVDVFSSLDEFTDYVEITAIDRDIRMSAKETRDEGDERITTQQTDVVFEDVLSESVDEMISLFSLEYLTSMVSALKKARVETVTLGLGDGVPAFLNFEREKDGQVLYSGQYALAPRVRGDADE